MQTARLKRRSTIAAVLVPLLLPALCMSPDISVADEAPTLLHEQVVTASRLPQDPGRIATSVTVLDQALIAAHGNQALQDVLRQQPAVQASSNGGPGQPTSIKVRGEEGFRTLLVMDGIRLSDASAPQIGPLFEHQLSVGTDRVEILRGPQGFMYGADAGGVINIRSARPDPGWRLQLDGQSGSNATRQLSASLAAAGDNADISIVASRYATAGFNSLASDQRHRDRDGYDNRTLHLRGGVELGNDWRLELVRRQVNGHAEYDNCFSVSLDGHDCEANYGLQATRVALSRQDDQWRQTLAMSDNRSRRYNINGPGTGFGSRGRIRRAEYQVAATALPGFDLIAGADIEQARADGFARDNRGLYVEWLGDFSSQWLVSAGLRHDDNNTSGANTSYRVSGAYVITLANAAEVKLKSSLGSGFRAPSPYETAYNNGPLALAPAAGTRLEQERSRGGEAGIEFRSAQLHLETVWFDQRVDRAIYFDLARFSGYLQESGTSTSRGSEWSMAWRPDAHWRLSANLTRNATRTSNGQQRLRRPGLLFNAGLSWYGPAGQLNLNAFLRGARDSIDARNDRTLPLDDYAVLDLTGRFRLSGSLTLYARVENALAENYREVLDYNTAGRTFHVGLHYRLGSDQANRAVFK